MRNESSKLVELLSYRCNCPLNKKNDLTTKPREYSDKHFNELVDTTQGHNSDE